MDYALTDQWGSTIAVRATNRTHRHLLVALGIAVLAAGLAAGALIHVGGRTVSPPIARPESDWSAVPLAARGAVAATLGAADPQFAIHHAAGGGLVAANRAQRLDAGFAPTGVQVRSGTDRLGIRVTGYGFTGALQPFAPSAPSARANQVTYASPGMSEAYANGPLGLEQTFTIAHPTRTGGGPLIVSMTLSGNLHSVVADGGITFSRSGRSILAYRDLTVIDARGRRLPARLVLHGNRLAIRIDANGAAFPVRVDPYVQSAKLTASDGAADDEFGYTIAVSNNGSTVALGAPEYSPDGRTNQGAVYVFSDTSGTWKQTKELTAANAAAYAYLGRSLAISGDGSTVVAGASDAEVGGQSQGAVYVFSDASGSWGQTAELSASDGATGDSLGWSVAVSGDGSTVAAGAVDHAVNGTDYQGAVYVFSNASGSWKQTAELTATDGGYGDTLGTAVALSSTGSTVVAGAGYHTDGGNSYEGAVYVFADTSGTWTQTAELTPTDGATYDEFGAAVAMSSDASTIVVGAPNHAGGGTFEAGTVYVFGDATGSWEQTEELVASDRAYGDELGASVAVSSDGKTVVAGAPADGEYSPNGTSGDDEGGAYLWSDETGSWALAKEWPGSGTEGLGAAVAMSSTGSTIAVGAPIEAVDNNPAEGAAYVFTNGTTTTTTAPKVVTDPVITGTAKAKDTLTCSKGTWTGDPTKYAYQWDRDGIPLAGATASTLAVVTLDEGTTLGCVVTASNAKGSASAKGKGVTVSVPTVKGCPAATGTLAGTHLGLATLGMTKTQADHAYRHHTAEKQRYEAFFCLTPIGVRVGYPSPKLLRGAAKKTKKQLKNRVIWASTENPYYAIDGVRVGEQIILAPKPLRTTAPLHIGMNDWYLASTGTATAVLRVRDGVVEEIGIAVKALTQTSAEQKTLLHSFE